MLSGWVKRYYIIVQTDAAPPMSFFFFVGSVNIRVGGVCISLCLSFIVIFWCAAFPLVNKGGRWDEVAEPLIHQLSDKIRMIKAVPCSHLRPNFVEARLVTHFTSLVFLYQHTHSLSSLFTMKKLLHVCTYAYLCLHRNFI